MEQSGCSSTVLLSPAPLHGCPPPTPCCPSFIQGSLQTLQPLHSALLPKDHLLLPNTIPLLGLYTTLLPSTPAGLEPVILPLEEMSILCLVITILCHVPSHLSKTTLDSSVCVSDNVPLAPAPWESLPSVYHLICRLPSQNPFLHVHVQNPNGLSAAALLVPNTLPKDPVPF